MSISAIFANSTQGILAGMNRTADSAARIARGISDDPDAASAMVGLRQGENDTRAAIASLKAADEMLGTLINIRV